MIAQSEWKHDDVFEGKTESGSTIVFDADSAHTLGPSPMEAVLMALCCCTSVDVVSILQKKRQGLTGLRVSAAAQSIFQLGIPETAFLTVGFAGGVTANVQVSWLAPRKMRQMVVVGSRRMVSYEDTSSDEAIRIYDRGLDFCQTQAPATFGEYQLTYRSGDIVVPRIDAAEPLALESESVNCP